MSRSASRKTRVQLPGAANLETAFRGPSIFAAPSARSALTNHATSGENKKVAPPQHVGLWRSLGARFHGMEEVVGSIPTRSTKSFLNITLNRMRAVTPRSEHACPFGRVQNSGPCGSN